MARDFNEGTLEGADDSPGGLDLSRRGLIETLDLDTKKKSVSAVEKISTVSKS